MSEQTDRHQSVSVGQLIAALDRHKKALSEAGLPELAARAHVRLEVDGRISFDYQPRVEGSPRPEVIRAVELDLEWRAA